MVRYGEGLFSLSSFRLFQSQDVAANIEQQIRDSELYRRDPSGLEKLLKLKNGKLQQYVRGSWTSNPASNSTEASAAFLLTVVKPAIKVNVASIPNDFSDITARFTAVIASGRVDETEVSKLKIALGALDGRLDSHPLLHGLALQCFRKVDKQMRGIETMRGRRTKESDKETSLIADAGLSLAMVSGNKALARESLVI